MIMKQPSEKAIRKVLVKSGHRAILERFDNYQNKLLDAIKKGVITEQALRGRFAPKEYLELYDKHAKARDIINNHINNSFAEIEAFSENPAAEYEALESDDMPVVKNDAKPTYEQLMQNYERNPSRDNIAKVVKEHLGGGLSTKGAQALPEARFAAQQKERSNKLSSVVKTIKENVFKDAVADQRKESERNNELKDSENYQAARVKEALSDKRLSRGVYQPENKEFNAFQATVKEQAKINEESLEGAY